MVSQLHGKGMSFCEKRKERITWKEEKVSICAVKAELLFSYVIGS